MNVDFIANWLASTPIFAVPLIIAALGLIINERAGVLNLGAEGFLLCGALASMIAYLDLGGNMWVGLMAAIVVGAIMGAIFAFLVVILRNNQVVTGITFVFFGSGLTGLLGTPWTNKAIAGIQPIYIPILSDIPYFGKVIFSQDLVVYATALIPYFIWRYLNRSLTGLRLRAVGENPQAADADGVSVTTYRFVAVVVGGAFLGLAGGYLVLASAKIFVFDMTHGRGWIAIALVIFSRWMPGRAVLGGLLFGGIEALIPRIMAAGLPVPQYYLLMMPYAITLAVLIYSAVSSRHGQNAPLALGLPYIREDRR